MVYLDYAAGEKIDDDVLNLYTNYLKDCYPNPNSNHTLGKEMMKKIDDATKKYLDLLQLDDTYEIVYTSSATESNNLALKGCAKRYKNFGNKIIISSMEHTSITASCEVLSKEGFDIEVCPVKNDGKVDLDELKNMIDDSEYTDIVSYAFYIEKYNLIGIVVEGKSYILFYINHLIKFSKKENINSSF